MASRRIFALKQYSKIKVLSLINSSFSSWAWMAWLRELLKQEMLLMLFLLFQRDSPKREIEKQQVTWNRTMDIHIQIHTHTQACSQTQKLWMEWRNNLIHWLTSGLTAGWLATVSRKTASSSKEKTEKNVWKLNVKRENYEYISPTQKGREKLIDCDEKDDDYDDQARGKKSTTDSY